MVDVTFFYLGIIIITIIVGLVMSCYIACKCRSPKTFANLVVMMGVLAVLLMLAIIQKYDKDWISGTPLTVEMLREGPFLKVVTYDEESGLSQITLVEDKNNPDKTQGKVRVITGLELKKGDIFFVKDDAVIVIK